MGEQKNNENLLVDEAILKTWETDDESALYKTYEPLPPLESGITVEDLGKVGIPTSLEGIELDGDEAEGLGWDEAGLYIEPDYSKQLEDIKTSFSGDDTTYSGNLDPSTVDALKNLIDVNPAVINLNPDVSAIPKPAGITSDEPTEAVYNQLSL